ncbi:right-handed parallel beta-helix repeat-containing protein [Paenibacillus hamazuiensis]|uniref:alpha-1,3-galactosidase-related protein n=1 Tax=Paenibacillus hamazuiensis TaxID=2936508 RepID=UPI00201080FB|nr:right-handed parallel beta-helix repeat-containing protein [Paenibacillus hamazuiensis]
MLIRVEDFGVVPDSPEDATLAVYRAIKQCRGIERPTLVFPKGTYRFKPEKAFEKQLFITNHDQRGLHKIAFPLVGMDDLTIDGQGSEFVFYGSIIPFLIENSRNVRLRNMTIDWERPMFEQGEFVRATPESFDIRLSGPRYELNGNRLTVEYDGREEAIWGIHEVDPETGAHAYGSGDRLSWSSFKKLTLEEVGKGIIRFSGKPRHVPKPGSGALMRLGRREHPGIFLKDSSDCRIEDVTVHHAPGMGLVAQRCADISLRGFNVMRRPGAGRWVTATADAVHFTYCRGRIELEHCLFENQLDDPLNVHGIYARIAERLSDDTLLVQLIHDMQVGVEIADPGDDVRFVDNESLLAYAEATVTSVEKMNARYTVISFDRPLPDMVKVGNVLENATWSPDLTIRHCTFRSNRARGLLITTPGKVLVEHNVISAPGAGIKISGDANSWYESGAVRDVVIRNNTFLDCNYCYPDWGNAVIDIDPEIEHPERFSICYHRNIRIEHNEFHTFDSGIVSGHSVDGFVFRHNRIRRSGSFPPNADRIYAIELAASRNADISDNVAEGGSFMALVGTDILNGLKKAKTV